MKIIKTLHRVKRVHDLSPLLLTVLVVPLLLSYSATSAGALELPKFVAGKITAAMSQEDLEGIVIEEYDGTLVVKGLVWKGEAAWFGEGEEDGEVDLLNGGCDDEIPGEILISSAVRIRGVLLTQGPEEEYVENPGILWLEYIFTGEDGETLGRGEGFITLAKIERLKGASSYQGSIEVEEEEVLFCGTGQGKMTPFMYFGDFPGWLEELEAWYEEALAELDEHYRHALAELEEICGDSVMGCDEFAALMEEEGDDEGDICEDEFVDCDEALTKLEAWYERALAELKELYQKKLARLKEELLEDRLVQFMGQTVLTAEKPGFDFEAAEVVPQLKRMFLKAKKKLKRARHQRKNVIRDVNLR